MAREVIQRRLRFYLQTKRKNVERKDGEISDKEMRVLTIPSLHRHI